MVNSTSEISTESFLKNKWINMCEAKLDVLSRAFDAEEVFAKANPSNLKFGITIEDLTATHDECLEQFEKSLQELIDSNQDCKHELFYLSKLLDFELELAKQCWRDLTHIR